MRNAENNSIVESENNKTFVSFFIMLLIMIRKELKALNIHPRQNSFHSLDSNILEKKLQKFNKLSTNSLSNA